MRRLANVLVLILIVIGLIQIWPLIAVHISAAGKQVPGSILAFDVIEEADGRQRLFVLYDYIYDTDAAQINVLSSQLADISGQVIDDVYLSEEQLAFYQPLLEDADQAAKYFPNPVIFIDPADPQNSGRLYFAVDGSQYRSGILAICLPILVWLCSLLLRSFVQFHREPFHQSHVIHSDAYDA